MVVAGVDDLFLFHLRVRDVVDEGPSDAAPRAGVDETILRAGVEGVFPVHELGVQHDVALLRGGFQVGQTLPADKIAGAGDAAGGDGRGQGAGRSRRILALHAEQAVDPAILVARQPHVIDIGGRLAPFGQVQRAFPEAEMVHPAGSLRHGEKGFAVGGLHTGDQDIFVFPFDGAAVEHGIDAETLHQIGVGPGIEVVAPRQGGVRSGEDGMPVAFIKAVPDSFEGTVQSVQQYFLLISKQDDPFVESTHSQ